MKWNLAISLIVCLAASVCSAGLDDFFHIPDRVKCKEVLVIIGRGTSEPPGEGPQRIFGKELQRRLGEDRVDHIPLDWPASLFPTYGESVRRGTEAVKRTVARYVDSCPHIKIVLMGFSQGAQVLSDTLCGMDEATFPKTTPIDPKLAERIVAVVGMGDPTHNPGQPYNVGTATRKGWFPRRNDESCRKYDPVRVSYCDHGDIYCDHGVDPLVHSSYFKNYFEHCMQFMIEKIEEIDP
ncbi:acetylxylan esterase [Trichophyton mentagrophytes]|nr:acetylxylan esterase [Trichophyton mentagrophytes]